MKKELVSIIVAVYNAQEYVEQCLESLRCQTYREIEIIVVDDGSNDESLSICQGFCEKDSRISVITQVNSGVSAARNRGIEVAKGTYMLFVDSDDYVEKCYVECLVNALKQSSDAQIAICGYKRIKQAQVTDEYIVGCEMSIEDLYRRIFAENTILSGCWNKIFLSEIIQNNHLRFDTDIHIGEDMLFIAKYLMLVENRYIYIAAALYCYRCNDNSALKSSRFNMKKVTCLDAVRKLQELCYEKDLANTHVDYCFSYRAVRSSLWLLYQMIVSGGYNRKIAQNIKYNIRKNIKKYKKYYVRSKVERTAVRMAGIMPLGVYWAGRILLYVVPEAFDRYIS